MSSPAYLKSKFQIGSAAGRVQYKSEEQVFHSSDITQKAKEAKQYIRETVKRSTKLHSHPPWSPNTTPAGGFDGKYICGVRPAPWDKDNFENRYYSRFDTKKRLEDEAIVKHTIINNVDTNTKAIQQHWNHTVVFNDPIFSKHKRDSNVLPGYTEVHRVRALTAPTPKTRLTFTGKTNLGTGQPRQMPLDEVEKAKQNVFKPKPKPLPANYQSLMTRSQIVHTNDRRRKAEQRNFEQEAYDRIDHGFNVTHETFPFEQAVTRKYNRQSAEEVKEQLEMTYTPDMLTEYLNINATMDFSNVPTKRKSRRPVMLQAQGNGQIVKFHEHLGNWQYSEREGCSVYSCCMSADKNSQGCSSKTIINQKRWNSGE